MIFLKFEISFEIGQRQSEAIMHSWRGYLSDVPDFRYLGHLCNIVYICQDINLYIVCGSKNAKEDCKE